MKVKGSSEGESDVKRAEKGMVVATRCPRLVNHFARASAIVQHFPALHESSTHLTQVTVSGRVRGSFFCSLLAMSSFRSTNGLSSSYQPIALLRSSCSSLFSASASVVASCLAFEGGVVVTPAASWRPGNAASAAAAESLIRSGSERCLRLEGDERFCRSGRTGDEEGERGAPGKGRNEDSPPPPPPTAGGKKGFKSCLRDAEIAVPAGAPKKLAGDPRRQGLAGPCDARPSGRLVASSSSSSLSEAS